MEKIPTAEKFLEQYLRGNRVHDDIDRVIDEDDAIEAIIEFAKLHVEQALKEASKKAQIKYEYSGNVGEYCDEFVDVNSILNSYPLENIK
jgi:hypothetical protein